MTSAPPYALLVVAVDGPSGSGKSTVSRRTAVALGLRYLDTGAMYRAAAWAVLDRGIDPQDADAVAATVAAATISSGTDPAAPTIAVDGRRVDAEIRGPEVSGAVSAVSAVADVRRRLVAQQQAIIGDGGIVVEGRDIGTVVAPQAPVKIYLTASGEARAQRRSAELSADVAQTLADLNRRDKLDSTRAVDPLQRAGDAHEIDSTDLGIDDVVTAVLGLCAPYAEPAGRTS